MADAAIAPLLVSQPSSGSSVTTERYPVRIILVATAVVFLVLFLLLPLAAVFVEAFRAGLSAYFAAITESDAVAAIRLTLLVAAIAVPANIVFGLAASWAIAKFEFKGKSVLNTLIDLPFSVSPVRSTCFCSERKGTSGTISRATTSRSSSRCRASYSPPSSPPSPSSPASSCP